MNIIEGNYLSKLNLRDTQKAMQIIESMLIEKINEKIDFSIVRAPIISSKKIITSSSSFEIGRSINFDSSNDNVIYNIFNNFRYWLVNALYKMDIKNNNGIGIISHFINRDSEIKNTQSLEKRVLLIEYRYDNKDNAFSKALDIKQNLIAVIRDIEKKLKQNFPKLKIKIPSKIITKKKEKIHNLNNIDQVLSDIGANDGIFIFENKKNLKKNKSFKNTFVISLNSYSREIDESYEIFRIQDRRLPSDFKLYVSDSDLVANEYNFAKEQLGENEIRSINIEINLDTLSMFLLEKAHILEIQSGYMVQEIEDIISNVDIEHL
ncbi:MAG: hypothetical protein TYPL_0580 [Candidatus Tyloplasma litorale]|nr:MAG: hypothetical protein TYPL_0580 [Mycoplasmatales bacterium]